MSPSYFILCLSHDPAIILDPQLFDVSKALDAATAPADHIGIAHHATCDLLLGTWNNGLISITCPPRPHPREDGCHRLPIAVGVEWLQLLAAACETALPDPGLTTALKRLPGCWSAERVYRLRNLLEPAPIAEPVLTGTPA